MLNTGTHAMKTLWWKVRYTLCFCQHVGWHCAGVALRLEEPDMSTWHPVDACLEELSYWND